MSILQNCDSINQLHLCFKGYQSEAQLSKNNFCPPDRVQGVPDCVGELRPEGETGAVPHRLQQLQLPPLQPLQPAQVLQKQQSFNIYTTFLLS